MTDPDGGHTIVLVILWASEYHQKNSSIYRQSPVKLPDIKNIKVVTFMFLLNVPHYIEATYN